MDKPIVFGISGDKKPRDFLTQYTKTHRLDPGPKYEVQLDMTKKSPVKENPPRILIKKDKIPTRVV